MQAVKSILRPRLLPLNVPAAGVQSFTPPKKTTKIILPEKPRLSMVLKVPNTPPGMRPFKMQKRLRYMRGPEPYHTELMHKQYGIIALTGGRMKYGHYEMVRMTLLRNVDYNKIFAIWRIDQPWQPLTRKGQGQRMGGGKGAIDEYCTPVKAGRVIMEVAGNVEFFEVEKVLVDIARKLPFGAMAVSQEIMEKRAAEKKRLEQGNKHNWTWKYMIQNNMHGCHKWIAPVDKFWFNEYR